MPTFTDVGKSFYIRFADNGKYTYKYVIMGATDQQLYNLANLFNTFQTDRADKIVKVVTRLAA